MYRLGPLLIIFIVVQILLGCASNFIVVDETGMTFSLKNTRLQKEQEFEILDGEAVRKVPLKNIAKLVLDPTTTHFKNDNLYYHAKVELVDGTEIKPRINGPTTTKSFVNINNVVMGKGASGDVSIPLENVNVISKADVE